MENEKLQLLNIKLKEYIKLLGDELSDIASFMFVHGWTSKKERIEEGIRLRKEIEELEKE